MKVFYKGLATLAIASAASCANADSKQHRLIWDADPATQATIGFTPSGSNNHYVKYGTTTDEQSWTTKSVTATRSFSSLQSHFVKLTGLPANSPVYYKVCDDSGCGTALWFKTAPADNSPYIAVAGGDTRTGWTTRKDGNKLIAKIRPLFIMHGGDYTNANSASEMSQYLDDWQLTFSNDLIDGISYKRIYPFVATHGNHEDGNYNTLCQVFGVDYDQNGSCDANDTYGAFNVSPLLRVYTLNSQFKNSGWSSYAVKMNNWLKQDMASQGASAQWRFAQYHKPMYPHYSGKSDNTELFTWWAESFYDYGMNLVVESDTHINKITEALVPSGNGFSKTTSGGTVFVGEGSWGAPARSANDPKSWTIDLASIQQFKVISVTADKIEVKTAQFNASADTLSYEQRQSDALILPNNINWWVANTIGDTLSLKQSSNGKSIIETSPIDDVSLINGVAKTGLAAAKDQNLFFTMPVPADVKNLKFELNGGDGDADLYVRFGQNPDSKDFDCRPYESGNNEVCNIENAQAGTYYIMLKAYNSFAGASLTGSYSHGGFSETITDIAATEGIWYHKSLNIPSGITKFEISISGGTGDADLYVQKSTQPDKDNYICRPYLDGNTESCSMDNPAAASWHIGIKAFKSFSNLTLTYSYQ